MTEKKLAIIIISVIGTLLASPFIILALLPILDQILTFFGL